MENSKSSTQWLGAGAALFLYPVHVNMDGEPKLSMRRMTYFPSLCSYIRTS